jgi:hypothetical protein
MVQRLTVTRQRFSSQPSIRPCGIGLSAGTLWFSFKVLVDPIRSVSPRSFDAQRCCWCSRWAMGYSSRKTSWFTDSGLAFRHWRIPAILIDARRQGGVKSAMDGNELSSGGDRCVIGFCVRTLLRGNSTATPRTSHHTDTLRIALIFIPSFYSFILSIPWVLTSTADLKYSYRQLRLTGIVFRL